MFPDLFSAQDDGTPTEKDSGGGEGVDPGVAIVQSESVLSTPMKRVKRKSIKISKFPMKEKKEDEPQVGYFFCHLERFSECIFRGNVHMCRESESTCGE